MTKLMALETSGTLCSVAIHCDGIWAEDTQNVQRLHNQVLLRQIDGLVQRSGTAGRAFEVIAFGAGPGSFTGVRIAAATAQALAFAHDGRVVPVSSSLALAQAASQDVRVAAAAGVITVIRSRRDAHYIAAYRFGTDPPTPLLADALYQGLEQPDLSNFVGWAGVGDRPPWWDEGQLSMPFHEHCVVTAGTIGRLALAVHAAGGGLAPEQALPIYVAGDSPWKPHAGTGSASGHDPGSAPAPRAD